MAKLGYLSDYRNFDHCGKRLTQLYGFKQIGWKENKPELLESWLAWRLYKIGYYVWGSHLHEEIDFLEKQTVCLKISGSKTIIILQSIREFMATAQYFSSSVRKYSCVFFPLILCVIIILQDLHVDYEIKPFVILLLSSLIFQSLMIRSLFSDSIEEFSEMLSTKPLILSSMVGKLGTKLTVFTVAISKYLLSFSIILALMFIDFYENTSIENTVALSIALGLMLDPIINDIFDSEEFTELVNSVTIFLAYMALIVVGIGAATLAQDDPSNLLLDLMPEFLYVALIYSFLLTRVQFLVMVSFQSKKQNIMLSQYRFLL